MMPLMNK